MTEWPLATTINPHENRPVDGDPEYSMYVLTSYTVFYVSNLAVPATYIEGGKCSQVGA